MQTIPIIYSRSNLPLSLAIRTVDRGPVKCPFSHVGKITPDGNNVIEALGGRGVVTTPLDEFKARSTAYQMGEFPVWDSPNAAYSRARQQLGKRYDFKAVIGLGLPFIGRKWDDPEKWFCSELLIYSSGMVEEHYANAIGVAYCYALTRNKQEVCYAV